jgi:hypothetical protein
MPREREKKGEEERRKEEHMFPAFSRYPNKEDLIFG